MLRQMLAAPVIEVKRQAEPPPVLSRLGLIVLLCGAVLPLMDFFIVNVALPTIDSALAASGAALELVVAGYGVAYALLLIVGGRLGDAYGRCTVFNVGLAGFTLASLLCGLAPSIGWLLGARIAQGVAGALVIPQVLATFQATLDGERRAKALGLYAATAGTSAVAGQLIGGLLVTANLAGQSWRPIFLVNVPIGLVVLALAPRIVPNTRSENPASVDLAGTALLALSLIALLVPLTEGRSLGWPLWTWLVLAIAPLAAAALWRIEQRTERRGGLTVLPPSLVGLRSVRRGAVLGAPFFLGFGAFMFVFSLTLQHGLHKTALQSGLAITPFALMFLIGSLLAPRLIARIGRTAITIGGLVQAVALASLVAITVEAWPNVSLAEITPSLAVAGFGGSFIFVSLFRLVLADVPVHLAGIGSGLMITLQQSAYALGVATLGTLFLALGDRTASGFAWVVGIQASIALVVAVGSLALPAITTPSGESLELESLPLEV
jgi:MFS family permease